MPRLPRTARHSLAYVLLTALFLATRLYYASEGIQFLPYMLEVGWQHIDAVLLENRLMESLVYLHSQPPLWNLLLGLLLKGFGSEAAAAAAWLFKAIGLLLTWLIYATQRRLDVTPVLAFATTGIFIASPATILFENWLYATYPLTLLLLLTAFSFTLLRSESSVCRVALVGACFTACCLTRAAFHIIWPLGFAGILFALRWQERRVVALSVMLGLIAVVGWYAKNAILFDRFAASSWFGMHLAHSTTDHIPREEQVQLIMQGEISEIIILGSFGDADKYRAYWEPSKSGIPVLDSKFKERGGGPNFNNNNYLRIESMFRKASFYIIQNHPRYWLRGIKFNLKAYLTPLQSYPFFQSNRERMGVPGQITHALAYLGSDREEGRSAVLAGAYILAFLAGAWVALHKATPAHHKVGLLFMLYTLSYVAAVSLAIDGGESNRMRFPTDPFAMILLVYCCQTVFHHLLGKYRRRSGDNIS